MRFGAAISLLCAVAAVAPAAFAMPVASDATDGLEARAYDAEVADLIARSDFDEATSLVARAVADVLSARSDPPRYHKNDPSNGKKPKYSEKDPNPPPKYRQKDPHKPNREPKPKPGPSRRTRELAEVDDLWAREADEDLWAREELEEMWARDVEEVMARSDPPHYHKNDPINGKKPKYSEKDPNPPPKYRQKDPHKPNREPKPKPGPSGSRRTRELADFWW